MYFLLQIRLGQAAFFINFFTKSFYIFFPHRKPSRHFVSTILCKKLFTGTHFFIHMIRLHRTPGTLYPFFPFGQYKCGPSIFFPDSPGYNPSQAFMHFGQICHQYPVPKQSFFLNMGNGLFCSFYRHFLADIIQVFQFLGNFHSLRPAFTLQKFQCPLRCIQSPCGIHAWA